MSRPADQPSGAASRRPRVRLPRPWAWLAPDVVAASLAVNLLALAMPIVVLQIYDRIVPNKATETFAIMMGALVVVALLDGLIRYARSVILAWRGARYEYRHSLDALGHLLHADLVSFEREARGAWLDKLQALEQVREFHHGQAVLMLLDLPFVLLFLWLIWIFAGDLVLIPLAVIGVFVVISLVNAWLLRRALETRSVNDERRQNFLIEVLQGIHSLKSLAMEPQIMRRYERLQGQSADAIYVLARLSSVVQGLGATFSQAVMVSFLGVGAIAAVSGEISIGALAAGTMLAGRVLQPALRAMGLWSQLQSVRLAREKFEHVIGLPSEAVREHREPCRLEGAIELDDVHFAHPGSDAELLRGVSLKVAPGEAIGITGANGAGKSTLVDLLMGFVHPVAGEVRYDGRPLHELDRSSMRAQIGLVPQRGVLFGGTILENMTLFREGAAIDDAIELAGRLGLARDITRMAEGLDTPLDGGIADTLSAGFRQRVITVRALVGRPKVVVFDDANAAFDSRNDSRLAELLRGFRGDRTMVIVSHRPSILRLCDRVFELAHGQLSERADAPAPAARAPLGLVAGARA